MRIWDISPPVHAGSPVFPGDTAYQQRWASKLGAQSPVNVASITTTPHVGAHADGPLHYDPQGEAIGAVPLEPYLGRCRVIHAWGFQGPGARHTQRLLRWPHLEHAIDADLPPRVLLRTYSVAPLDRFDPLLPSFAPETIERLADLGVQLIGIDSASIDPADSKTLDSHHAVRRRRMRILENLVLDEVPEGDYELIALPLKLVQADASPVRAVLRELPPSRPRQPAAA
ncbi:MAG TPA: arylformamidase [Methylibium sp.]|uniref:arylformamidase n=1 Tax=Methylibium sp. TaxID=2067992 RepID=UPI002DBDCA7F|nr:arylformamidase [Methylibium sp.]HEU4459349.1 arylformamidase [Methylibium sp.]